MGDANVGLAQPRGAGRGGGLQSGPWVGSHLLVHKLSGILLDVAFVQVGGHAHEAYLGQAEVRQLDVAEGGDEQAVGGARTLRLGVET